VGHASSYPVNRTATAWLCAVHRSGCELLFCAAEDVARVQESAIGFDAPDARYPHETSVAMLVERWSTSTAPAILPAAHGAHRSRADFRDVVDAPPESSGLRAISHGFPAVSAGDDETLDRPPFSTMPVRDPHRGPASHEARRARMCVLAMLAGASAIVGAGRGRRLHVGR